MRICGYFFKILTDFLSVVAMTLLACTVYGLHSDLKERMLTDSLVRDIAACIQLSIPNNALVGRAACILLCNLLAGCDSNIAKARAFFTLHRAFT